MENSYWFNICRTELKWEKPWFSKRRSAWYTKFPCKCLYDYGGKKWEPQNFPIWMNRLTSIIMDRCNFGIDISPTALNANLYVDGEAALGWHSDDERLFRAEDDSALTISLSLGDKRTFEVRDKVTHTIIDSIVLDGGDLAVMTGQMQNHYDHRISPSKAAAGQRINLTWRFIFNHDDKCGLCRDVKLPNAIGDIKPLSIRSNI